MPTMPLAQSNRGAPLGHHSSRSWRVRRLEDCNRDRLADANVESFDTWSGIIPQPDRLGAKREGALMARFESRHERTFALRAEAIGLRYNAGPRVEAFNVSIGQPITIAVFQSADAP